MFIIGGIIGSAVFGVTVEIYKNYRMVTIIICGISSVMPIVLMLSFLTGNTVLVSICCMLTGFAMVAILPVGMDFGVELTHPIPEPVSSGLLMSAGAIFGIFLIIVSSESINYFTNKDNATLGCNLAQIVMTLIAWIAFGTSFCIKEDLKRIRESKEKEKNTFVKKETSEM